MAFTSLQRRIVIVFVGLLVLVMVMGLVLALVHTSSKRIVSSEVKQELAVGAKVFKRLLEQNQRQLETAATVLSGDFAFREAIATQDQPTVRSVIRNHGQRIGGSIGIALYPQDGQDASSLLRRAELAMTAAKRRHVSVAFAADIGSEPAHEQLSLIGDMREAIANGQFMVFYQPKLALSAGRIVAAEALLRWQHPERGMIAPARFIPFAEQTGFIREITPWLLESVIGQISRRMVKAFSKACDVFSRE